MITLPIASFEWTLMTNSRVLCGTAEASDFPEMKRIEKKILIQGQKESIVLDLVEQIMDAHDEDVCGWMYFGQLAQGREVRVTIFND